MASIRELEVERAEAVSPLYESIERLTPADGATLGRRARLRAPREVHSAWSAPADREDPLALLEEQARTRVAELLPIRYGRMLASPFAFYSGAAAVMAADLAHAPESGFEVQLCGDAHVSNFGGFTSPENGVAFDICDFDETLPGPWEWDVKRLATSIHVAGRMRGCEDEDCRALVLTAVSTYRRAMQEFAALPFPAVLHSRLDMAGVISRWGREVRPAGPKPSGKKGMKADPRDKARSRETLTQRVRGKVRISEQLPFIVPIEALYSKAEQSAAEEAVRSYIWKLQQRLQGTARRLLDNFEYAHMARRVVGVGGVGLRSWIVLLLGKDYEEPLFLVLKECQASALEPHIAQSHHTTHGERVVEGQGLLQAVPDDFLGWGTIDNMPRDVPRDYYVRQLQDWKLTVDIEHIPLRDLLLYGHICGWILARAHACSGDRMAIAHYLGKGPAFDQAIAEFSRHYANQNERDFHLLRKAVERGAVKVQPGV